MTRTELLSSGSARTFSGGAVGTLRRARHFLDFLVFVAFFQSS
jgi:hypothetical protein